MYNKYKNIEFKKMYKRVQFMDFAKENLKNVLFIKCLHELSISCNEQFHVWCVIYLCIFTQQEQLGKCVKRAREREEENNFSNLILNEKISR